MIKLRCLLGLHKWQFDFIGEWERKPYIDSYGRRRIKYTFIDVYKCSRCRKYDKRNERVKYGPAEGG